MSRLTWSGTIVERDTCNMGPLPIVFSLLEKMDLANIIDRHLPPDPQLEFSHGQVLTLLLAARLCRPTALVNVTAWAEESGAEFLWNIPADKLNDDRLGRALVAFAKERHSILANVAAHVVSTFRLPCERLHYDTTHLLFCGVYDESLPIPDDLPLPPTTASADFPPAHITYGYAASDAQMIHAGLCSIVDDLGAVPIAGHIVGGNVNGRTAIAQQFHYLKSYHPQLLTNPLLMVSDRGTFSTAHVARLYHAGHHVLCSVPWRDFKPFFDQHHQTLFWTRASYLSVEQKRRRQCSSSLPKEHYELAVQHHCLSDPDNGTTIPCRLIFVFSSADQKVCQKKREAAVAKIRTSLERLAQLVARGSAHYTDPVKVHRHAAKLMGQRDAGRYFRWELLPLTAAEQAALPPPQRGCRRPSYRFVFDFNEQAAQADAAYDGYSTLLTTAPRTQSADTLFTQFKQLCYVEQAHHQWKTPVAVRPLFLKSPERIEALVGLLQVGLTAYHLLQRQYRQAVPNNEPQAEKRLTTESIFRAFRVCSLVKEQTPLGCVLHPMQLTPRQRLILGRLHFPTVAQILPRLLPRYPP